MEHNKTLLAGGHVDGSRNSFHRLHPNLEQFVSQSFNVWLAHLKWTEFFQHLGDVQELRAQTLRQSIQFRVHTIIQSNDTPSHESSISFSLWVGKRSRGRPLSPRWEKRGDQENGGRRELGKKWPADFPPYEILVLSRHPVIGRYG
jgi:hypothetical protein